MTPTYPRTLGVLYLSSRSRLKTIYRNRVEIGEISVGKFVSLRNRYFYYGTFILQTLLSFVSIFLYQIVRVVLYFICIYMHLI